MIKIFVGFPLMSLAAPGIRLAGIVLALLTANEGVTAATMLTFTDPPADTCVTVQGNSPCVITQYSGKGVIFPTGAYVYTVPNSPPGKQVLLPWNLAAGAEFPGPSFTIAFTSGQSLVGLSAGAILGVLNATLRAYDGSGALIAQDGPRQIPAGAFTTVFEVKTAGPSIRRVELTSLPMMYGGISELHFEGTVPAPLPSVPPVVKIASPQPNVQLEPTASLPVQGTVTGEQVMQYAALEIEFPQPPEYAGLPFTSSLPLTGSGTTKSFTLDISLGVGPHKLTVKATNIAGLAGSDTVAFVILPQAIQTKYAAVGGQGTLGDFKFGDYVQNCTIAVYDEGAITLAPPDAPHAVLGAIFKKWFPLRSKLSCPRDEEKAVSGVALASGQDFVDGRIYAHSKGTYYVVEPFRDAMDKLSFTNDYGLPITDPVAGGPLQAYYSLPVLLQTFEVSLGNIELVSTMELTDNPRTLWVAVPDTAGVARAGASITPRIATTWLSFSCNQDNAPCTDVHRPQPASYLPYSVLEQAAGNGHYPWGTSQWPPLAPGKIVPFLGNIKATGLSGDDAPWNHACSTGGFGGVDWDMHVVPDPPFWGLLGAGEGALEVEYEWCLVGYPKPNDPGDLSKGVEENHKAGDKLFIAGRWVCDAGCHPWYSCTDSYHSEVHPPSVLIDLYTGQANGKPATIGDLVYFDWWYPGQAAEVDIYPPPRPQVDANLVAGVPIWQQLCPSDGGNCGIQVSLEPVGAPNHVHLKISGRPDVPWNTPPKEDKGNGQLFHGLALESSGRAVLPDSFEHMVAFRGNVVVQWDRP